MTFLSRRFSLAFVGRYIHQYTKSPIYLGAVCLTHCICTPLTCYSIVRACGWVCRCVCVSGSLHMAVSCDEKIQVWLNATSMTRGHKVSHNAPLAYPTSLICLTPLWPWLTVRDPNESSHIVHCSLSAINGDTLHNTHLDQWYSSQSICQQLTLLIRGNTGNFTSPWIRRWAYTLLDCTYLSTALLPEIFNLSTCAQFVCCDLWQTDDAFSWGILPRN